MGVDTLKDEQVKWGLEGYKDLKVIDQDRTPENAFLRPEDFSITACIMTQSMFTKELQKCATDKIKE